LDEFAEPHVVPLAKPVELTELTELVEPDAISETPVEPSTTETIPPALICVEDQRVSALKRHLEECTLPAAKRRAGRPRIRKALDYRKFFPKTFPEKTMEEQATSKLLKINCFIQNQWYTMFFCDSDMANRGKIAESILTSKN
jgi:hypothetical protein